MDSKESNEFPIIGTMVRAIGTYKDNFALYTGLSMLSIAILAFAWIIDRFIGTVAFSFVAATFISLGLITTSLRTLRGEDTEFSDFFGNYKVYPLFLMSSLVVMFAVGTAAVFFMIMLAVTLGTPSLSQFLKISIVLVASIPLLLPALYIGARVQFYGFIMAEANFRSGSLVYESLEKSWDITKGRTFDILLLDIAAVFLLSAGAALFGFGLIFAIPISIISFLHVYDSLRGDMVLIKEPEYDD
jgi:hypothetical protein